MFKLDRSDWQRIAVSAIGALVLSAAWILAVSIPTLNAARAGASPMNHAYDGGVSRVLDK
jgi:hypothetical protein